MGTTLNLNVGSINELISYLNHEKYKFKRLSVFVIQQYLNKYLYFHQDGITTYILLHDYNDYKNNAYICWGVFTMLTYVRLS